MAHFGTVAAREEGTAAPAMILFTAVGTFSPFFCLGYFAEEWNGTLNAGSATSMSIWVPKNRRC